MRWTAVALGILLVGCNLILPLDSPTNGDAAAPDFRADRGALDAPLDVTRDAAPDLARDTLADLTDVTPDTWIRCGDAMVDPLTSVAHCGGCDSACAATINSCEVPACVDGSCTVTQGQEGDTCFGSTGSTLTKGKCWTDSTGTLGCCTGCWDGSSCWLGTDISACGAAGAPCDSCIAPPCNIVNCLVGSCLVTADADGTPCPGGTCHSGLCCMGCWNGVKCLPGTTSSACGSYGAQCTTCAAAQTCNTSADPHVCTF